MSELLKKQNYGVEVEFTGITPESFVIHRDGNGK